MERRATATKPGNVVMEAAVKSGSTEQCGEGIASQKALKSDFCDFNHTVKKNPMNGGGLDDFLREEGILEQVEAAAHQRVAELQKQPDDSDPPVWKRLHNSGVLKASPDESVWPAGKTTGRGGQPEALTSGCRS